MYHYEPLRRRLADETSERVAFSYADIEQLIDRKLPPSARGEHRRQWWANTDSHSQAKAWLSAGRRAKALGPELVEFRRSAPGTAPSSQSSSLSIPLGALGPAARRAIADLAVEKGLSPSEAAAAIIDQYALEQRTARFAWFQANTKASAIGSAELIRGDRDGR